MFKKINLILLILIMVLITGCVKKVGEPNQELDKVQEETNNKEMLVGGACSYDKIKGNCIITRIAKTEDSINQAKIVGGPGYEGYDIKYSFLAENEEDLGDKVNLIRKENSLRLGNSWYPGEGFISKYKISEQAEFTCELDLITKGTCTPTIYKFNDIDTVDYFETKIK